MAINSSLILNNAIWNGDIGFESLAEASCIIVKWLFISVYRQKKYHRSVRNVAMVCVAAVALGSSTYAWFVSNNKVDATTTNISAQSNSAYLVIEAGSQTTTNSKTSATGTEKTNGDDTALYPAQWKNNFNAEGTKVEANGVYQFE